MLAFVLLVLLLLFAGCQEQGGLQNTSVTPNGDGTVTLHTVHAILDTSATGQRLYIENRRYRADTTSFEVYECTRIQNPEGQ